MKTVLITPHIISKEKNDFDEKKQSLQALPVT